MLPFLLLTFLNGTRRNLHPSALTYLGGCWDPLGDKPTDIFHVYKCASLIKNIMHYVLICNTEILCINENISLGDSILFV